MFDKYDDLIIGMQFEMANQKNIDYCLNLINLVKRYYKCLVVMGTKDIKLEKNDYACSLSILWNIVEKNYNIVETDKDTPNSFLLYKQDNNKKKYYPTYNLIQLKEKNLSLLHDYLLSDMFERYKNINRKITFPKFIRQIIIEQKNDKIYELYPSYDKELKFLIDECILETKIFFENVQGYIKYEMNKRCNEFLVIYQELINFEASEEVAYNELLKESCREKLFHNLIEKYPSHVLCAPVNRDLWYGYKKGEDGEFLSEKVRYPLYDLENKIEYDFQFFSSFYKNLNKIKELIEKTIK